MLRKSDNIIIRDFEPEEFTNIQAFWRDLNLDSPERGDTPAIVEQTIRMGGKLLIMEDKNTGEIIGTSWITFDGRRLFLHHFGIRKSFQGQGWGTLLAEESLKYIKQKGYQVKLEVHRDNLIAKRLYEKVGFFSFTDYDIYMIRKFQDQ